MQTTQAKISYVKAVDGSPLSLSDLPAANTRRWVVRHKANLVAAVTGGLISLDVACERYSLSVDEFLSWQRTMDRFGLPGLRATRLHEYRS